MSWRRGRGLEQAEVHSWGKVFKDATKKQLNRREVDRNLVTAGYKPRRMHFSEDGTIIWIMRVCSGMR